jgi:GDP-D-mannose 3',5'-epimerase
MNIVVTGAGGFIGGFFVEKLLKQGHHVYAYDIKPHQEWERKFNPNDRLWIFTNHDLREMDRVRSLPLNIEEVYNFAADMGGMGFIENHKADCMLSVLINTNLLYFLKQTAQRPKFFYASSACVYPDYKQHYANVTALKEDDTYPAMPEDGYGWEKLFSERMVRHFREDYGFDTRVGRFHNVYGPHTTYDGGREKAPAAICRKVIEAKLGGKHDIEIWGDGEQTRSFMYIDDCYTGVSKLMDSDHFDPINIGSSELVTINQLVDIAEDIADISLHRNYNLDAPKGVRGRNSDNTKIKEVLDWEPSISLREGLEKTYAWIYDQMT